MAAGSGTSAVSLPPGSRPGHRHLLIRRNRSTGELAFYRCYSPHPVTLGILVTVAGLRWTIEENFQAGKGLTGLDEHQARRWTSWYRWVTLAMLAAAVLTIAAAAERTRRVAPEDQIPLTRNEIAPLLRGALIRLLATPRTGCTGHAGDAASQHRVRTCYYQRPTSPDRAT